jgi:two-component system CheB/CheR fusion protein
VAVHKDSVPFEHAGQTAAVRMEVRTLPGGSRAKQDLLVVFRKAEPAGTGEAGAGAAAPGTRAAQTVRKLAWELASTREELGSLIAEHETAQEEMKAVNEEILSSNEELQSTNEELETAKEELQSSNEELLTLNDELQHRNAELSVLSLDLNNLLTGVDIAVLVLDAAMRVRRFTPVAGTLLNLIPGDIGRPFSNIASTLDFADWNGLFAEATRSGRLVEREVRDHAGHRYSLRVRPYKTGADATDGVLVVLFDIEAMKLTLGEAEASRDRALRAEQLGESILNSLAAHVAVLDPDGTIVETNEAWDRFARENGAFHSETVGRGANYLQICRQAAARGVADAQAALEGIGQVLDGRGGAFQLEYPCHSPRNSAGSL